jgi:hypothetical protein
VSGCVAGVGADEPTVLLGAAYHLWRGGQEAMRTLIGLLRAPGYARRLACTPHHPPLPILLLEVLARGGTGARDTVSCELLVHDVGEMLDALAPKRASEHAGAVGVRLITEDERIALVEKALRHVAKRFELRYAAAENKRSDKRRASMAVLGRSVYDVAVVTLQRKARKFLHGLYRKRLANRLTHINPGGMPA